MSDISSSLRTKPNLGLILPDLRAPGSCWIKVSELKKRITLNPHAFTTLVPGIQVEHYGSWSWQMGPKFQFIQRHSNVAAFIIFSDSLVHLTQDLEQGWKGGGFTHALVHARNPSAIRIHLGKLMQHDLLIGLEGIFVATSQVTLCWNQMFHHELSDPSTCCTFPPRWPSPASKPPLTSGVGRSIYPLLRDILVWWHIQIQIDPGPKQSVSGT